MNVKHIVLILLVLFVSMTLFASGQKEEQTTSSENMMGEGEGKGGLMQGKGKIIKRIINNGEQMDFNGTIKPDEEDWILFTDDGNKYRLYMPPDFYLEEIGLVLSDGMKVKIKGFIYLKEVVPNVLMIDDKDYKFWDEFGVPPWAGSQLGKNKQGEGNS